VTDFHRTSVNGRSFIRGAARLLVAPYTQARPTKIADVIWLASGNASGPVLAHVIYDAMPGWIDLGATKTGIQITINNAEESFDVDQILADISSAPTNWECSVGTQLAEFTTEKMQIAWEGSEITVDDSLPVPEEEMGVGNPDSYTERRLAVLFQRPSGLIRAYLFHKIQRTPQESSVTFAKTGEQISIPVRFKVLADATISDPLKRFFIVRDQDVNPDLL